MKGFTLVEMMVSVAIFGLLFLAIFAILTAGNNVFQRDAIYLELQQNTRNGMDRIVREVRESRSSVITVEAANADRISFNTPNETGIRYYLSSGALIREYPSGTRKTLATGLGRLKFIKTAKLLTIDLRGEKIYQGGTFSFPLIESVRLRNE